MPAKKAATKATAKKAAKKTAAKKSPADSPAKKAAPAKKKNTSSKPTAAPSIEAITRQAYLNYLHRVQNGLPGDSHGDWIAAEKELIKG